LSGATSAPAEAVEAAALSSPPACQVGEAPVAAAGGAVQVDAFSTGTGASSTRTAGADVLACATASAAADDVAGRLVVEANPCPCLRAGAAPLRRESSQATSSAAATSPRPIHSHGSPSPASARAPASACATVSALLPARRCCAAAS